MTTATVKPRLHGHAQAKGHSAPCGLCPCLGGEKVKCGKCGLEVCRLCSVGRFVSKGRVGGERLIRLCKRCDRNWRSAV